MELVTNGFARRLVRTANKRVFALWKSRRRGKTMPDFADFNLNDADGFRENLCLVDRTADDDWVYRYYGRELARHVRHDMTGRRLSDVEARFAAPLRAAYEKAVDSGEAVLLIHSQPATRMVHSWERLVLPVMGPGGVSIISHAMPLVMRQDLIESILQAGSAALVACTPVLRPDGTLEDLSLLLSNTAASKLLGLAGCQDVGRSLRSLIDLDSRDLIDFCRLVLATGAPARLEAPWRIGQVESYFEICIARFDGGLTLTISDLGELRSAYRDLEAQKAEALAANRLLGEQAARLAILNEEMSRARAALHEEIAKRDALDAELRRLAATDDLTGVMNRRAFFEEIRREVARAERYGNPVSIAVLDLDRFKEINDRFGHGAGDETLRRVAGILSASGRIDIDQIGRLGGEEFGILMPETTLAGARIGAERLREVIERLDVEVDGVRIPVSASIGIAEWMRPDENLEAWLARADRALYRAKDQGRNRVVADEPRVAAEASAHRAA